MRAKTIGSGETTRLQGVVDAATAFLDDGLALISELHGAIAGKPFAALRLAPGVGEVSEGVRLVHDGITSLVYGSIRAGLTITGAAARAGAGFLRDPDLDPRPGSFADLALAAVNGFAGDRLHRSGNPLGTRMELRHRGRPVAIERESLAATFPHATPRLAVFVHGLACHESMWSFGSERHYGKAHQTYGSRLEDELGYTALYVRYNSGLHISENGRQLSRLLERIAQEWPLPVEEIALVGHSMGGLVCRSACHYGGEEQSRWIATTRHVVFLGSPHLGAPLEKGVNVLAWCLGFTDVTRPVGMALNRRSAGIKDLRFGSLCDEDWETTDLDALLSGRTSDIPLLAGANHYFVAATVTRSPRHPLGIAVGDLLVRAPSASGGPRTRHRRFPLENGRHFGPMNHLDLLNHPDVYRQLRQWLSKDRSS